MKSSIKTLFVILAIVMSFVAVQAVWAKGGPSCTVSVEGEVSALGVDGNDHAIVVNDDDIDEVTIYGIPLEWLDIELNDSVVVNCFVSPEGNHVACYLTVNGGDVIDLRPRAPK